MLAFPASLAARVGVAMWYNVGHKTLEEYYGGFWKWFYYLIKGESITGDTLAFLLTLNIDKIPGAITDTLQPKEGLTGTGSLMAWLSCHSSPELPTSRLVVCRTGCFLCLSHCWLAFMLLAAKCIPNWCRGAESKSAEVGKHRALSRKGEWAPVWGSTRSRRGNRKPGWECRMGPYIKW